MIYDVLKTNYKVLVDLYRFLMMLQAEKLSENEYPTFFYV